MNQEQSIETGFDRARCDLLAAGRNLWLAGLGAVASIVEADQESRELFDRLVERGRPLEEQQRKTFRELGDRTEETVREMRKLFRETVEYEGKGVLKKMGVLTRDDLKVLAARIDTLSQKIDELAAQRRLAAAASAQEQRNS
jgi:poly(hydroxyalkanoate) granule-associated protein